MKGSPPDTHDGISYIQQGKNQITVTCNHMVEWPKYFAEQKKLGTRVHTVQFHFHEALEHAKLISGDRNQNLGCL